MPFPFSLSLLSPVLCAALLSQAAHAQSGVKVNLVDGLLSVRASNVSAGELASELSNQLGISVVITGDTDTRINVDIVKEPFEKALAKLSPNNMLVRSNGNDIFEVVLMMDDGQDGASSGRADQFLPSGSPAEEVLDLQAFEQSEDAIDPELLRNPNRAAEARKATGAVSASATLPAEQVPPVYAEDDAIDPSQIDPATGLPYEK